MAFNFKVLILNLQLTSTKQERDGAGKICTKKFSFSFKSVRLMGN